MAQWTGQFSGITHDTKVQNVEDSLRNAIAALHELAETHRTQKLKDIRVLAKRLLSVRRRALRARLSFLTEPGIRDVDPEQVARLRLRIDEVESQNVEVILKEFGF